MTPVAERDVLCTQCRTVIIETINIDVFGVGETIQCLSCNTLFTILSLNPVSLQTVEYEDDEDNDEDYSTDEDDEDDYLEPQID